MTDEERARAVEAAMLEPTLGDAVRNLGATVHQIGRAFGLAFGTIGTSVRSVVEFHRATEKAAETFRDVGGRGDGRP